VALSCEEKKELMQFPKLFETYQTMGLGRYCFSEIVYPPSYHFPCIHTQGIHDPDMHQEEEASLDDEFCSISPTGNKEKLLVLFAKVSERDPEFKLSPLT
jgi:hypothetical protein